VISKEQMDRAQAEFRRAYGEAYQQARQAEHLLETYTYAPHEQYNPATRARYLHEYREADYMAESRAWVVQVLQRDRETQPKTCTNIPHNAVCFFKDGDKLCAVFTDFINLQESPAGFGDDFNEAMENLKQALASATP
jgi:hypothetical protein